MSKSNIKNIAIVITTYCLVIGCIGMNAIPKGKLGENYNFEIDGRNDLCIIDDRSTLIIQGCILKYAFNDNFIIGARRPRDSIPECTYKEINTILKDCEKAFENSTLEYYWIIDKRNNHKYDLLNKIEFNTLKDSLSVPNTLTLMLVKSHWNSLLSYIIYILRNQ